MKIHAAVLSLVLLSVIPASAEPPPSAINYQGVLRNASGAPQTGSFDMVFRFYADATGGTPLLTDTHNAGAPSGQVVVTNGLFTAALGTGTITPGSQPTLDAVCFEYPGAWLEVQVGAETLSPRVKIISSAYALNAAGVDGKDGSQLLDTSATAQTKAGSLQIGGALLDSSGDAGTSGQVLTSTGTGSNWVNQSSLSDGDWTISGSNLYSAVSGNVGIGTTGPGKKLDVVGAGGLRVSSTNTGSGTTDWIAGNFGGAAGVGNRVVTGLLTGRATIGAHNDALTQWAPLVINPLASVAFGNVAPVNKVDIAGGVAVGSGYAGTSAAPTNGMLVEGNVGIGTPSPTSRLHVNGSFRVDGYGDQTIDQSWQECRRWWATTTTYPQSQIFTAGKSGKLTRVDLTLRSPLDTGEAVACTVEIRAGEGPSGTILASQNGTIEGLTFQWHGFAFAVPADVVAGTKYTIVLQFSQFSWGWYWVCTSLNDDYAGGYYDNWSTYDMVFRTWVSTLPGVGFVVDSGGSVGIGTSAPAYKLQLAANSAAKPSTNTWTIASDERLKKNIRPFTDGLEVLDRINPVRYQYNGLAGTPKDEEAIGVLAQEMLGVAPYTVGTFRAKLTAKDESETALYDFNSHALTYIMINAIQELDARTQGLASGTPSGSGPIGRDPGGATAPAGSPDRAASSDSVDAASRRTVPTPDPSGGGSSVVMAVSSDVRAGDVVVIVASNGEALHPCNQAADRLVVGIALADAEDGKAPVAVGGIARVKADATLSPIVKGDLLVAAALPGHAMKMSAFSPGTVIGRALEPLAVGSGTIRVLVTLR